MDAAHARRELDRFLGIAPEDDDVSYEPVSSSTDRRAVYDASCPPRPAWFDEAACRSTGPDAFFAVGNTGQSAGLSVKQHAALALCATCPVLEPCRTYAREYRLHGIWGGETEIDRAAVGRAPVVGGTAAAARAAARARRRGLP